MRGLALRPQATPADIPLTEVAWHALTSHPFDNPPAPTSRTRFLLGCFPRKCAGTQGCLSSQRKQMCRVLFRPLSGTPVTPPSAAQWEPMCHFRVSGNTILMLPVPVVLVPLRRESSKQLSEGFRGKNI